MANESAGMPPKRTAVVFVKCEPKIETTVPLWPTVGVKDTITGAAESTMVVSLINVKPGLLAVPKGVVTTTLPLEPAPTCATMAESDITKNVSANVPPNLTAVVLPKCDPIMVTKSPLRPLGGEK